MDDQRLRNDGRRRGHSGCSDTNCTHAQRDWRPSITRRRLLGVVGVGTISGLTGCLGADTPKPVSLTETDACEVCGMVIDDHPGPSAQIFYRNKEPSGHENPARFDSTWEAFKYDFERRDRGWTRAVFYVTDYSAVDYEIFTDGGKTLISTHPAASAFVAGTEVTFVVASSVEGAMGQDLIAFSDDADASAFKDEYGGELVTFSEVTRSMIAELRQT